MRRKRAQEHENHERWLISYADFVTLLFAFFVVMFSSSQVDKRKVGKMALAMQVAFQNLGVFESSNTHIPLSQTQPMPFSTAQMVDNLTMNTVLGRVASSTSGAIIPAPGVVNLADLRHRLEEVLKPQILQKLVAVHSNPDSLVLSLRELGFYDSGSATLRPDAGAVIARVAQVLISTPCTLRIEGNTDNVPIHSAEFPSNWELSTTRATNLVRLFITKFGFNPERLSAAGYSQYHPVASNATAAGRAMNRRVDIVILPMFMVRVDSPRAAPSMNVKPAEKAAPRPRIAPHQVLNLPFPAHLSSPR